MTNTHGGSALKYCSKAAPTCSHSLCSEAIRDGGAGPMKALESARRSVYSLVMEACAS